MWMSLCLFLCISVCVCVGGWVCLCISVSPPPPPPPLVGYNGPGKSTGYLFVSKNFPMQRTCEEPPPNSCIKN